MRTRVEGQLRRVVAEALGVAPDELAPEVSLTDELAADSLDLLELVLAAEVEFQVASPDRVLDDVRTYGDLVSTVTALVCERSAPRAADEPGPVWARIVPPDARGAGSVERALRLTPYAAQTIADDALHAGRGTRLELEVPAAASDRDMATVQACFARLGERGVEVNVRRRQPFGPSAGRVSSAASAST